MGLTTAKRLSPQQGRAFGHSVATPLWPPSKTIPVILHNASTEREVVWRMLLAPAELRDFGRTVFPTPASHKKYWPDFRSFIRQAKTYDDAAMTVSDSSRGLLQYYAALQLAKAELLVHNPLVVFNIESRHGLSFRPEAAKSLRGDSLRVTDGVFRHLYELRAKYAIPAGTRLRIPHLLRAFSDIGFELQIAGLGTCNVTSIRHYVVSDATECWSLFALDEPDVFLSSDATMQHLSSRYRMVRLSGSLPTLRAQPTVVFEGRTALPIADPGQIALTEAESICSYAVEALSPYVGTPMYGTTQVAPSQLKTRFLPMPPDMARYAAIFYLSSIVRYKPSRLDDSGGENANWVMNAFSAEAGLHLLRAALVGITGTQHLLQPPGPFG